MDNKNNVARIVSYLLLPMFIALVAMSILYSLYGDRAGVAVRPIIMFYAFMFIMATAYVFKTKNEKHRGGA